MKRVLTAAVVGGLMIFAAPHGAWADQAPSHESGGQSAGQPQPDKADQPDKAGEPEQAPEPRQGDHEGHGDDGTILF